jgi:O-methyltransferase
MVCVEADAIEMLFVDQGRAKSILLNSAPTLAATRNTEMSILPTGLESRAFWERYRPVQENSEDWQSYCTFKGVGSDSLSKRLRLLSLAQLVRRIADNGIEGGFAECGCYTGHSTHVIARTMTLCGIDRPLLVFDSFEGLSPPTSEDTSTSPRHVETIGQQASLRAGRKMFATDMATTMRNLAEHKFIIYNPGWIPDTFAGLENERFAFLHIDVDLYEPTRASLEFFYERLTPGGIIQMDDYNFLDWPGAQKAVDDFVKRARPSFFFELPLGGAFLIK